MKQLFLLLSILLFCFVSFAQMPPTKPAERPALPYKLGERLTYSVSFANFNEAAFAETHVLSSGKFKDKDAIQIRAKVKTTDFVGAAFFALEETRTIFVAPDTGLPLNLQKTFSENGKQLTKTQDFSENSGISDLLSMLFQLRTKTLTQGSTETFQIQEGEQNFTAQFQIVGKDKIKTSAGEFETLLGNVVGLPQFPNLQINFTDDERHLPVLFRFVLPKGKVRAELAGIQSLIPVVKIPIQLKPLTGRLSGPLPNSGTPPVVYKDNENLSGDLPFALGEKLRFRIFWQNTLNQIAIVTLQAKERKQFSEKKLDSLLLTATVEESGGVKKLFEVGDSIIAYVEPDSLLPIRSEIKLSGAFAVFNQTLTYNQTLGNVSVNNTPAIEVPIGTHDLLSFAFAFRAFSLRLNQAPDNPVNDSRASVFLGNKANIFTLRPIQNEIIEISGRKVQAQKIILTTGNQTANISQIQLWVSNDRRRLPLRFSITGNFGLVQADLILAVQ